jgi:hypothetical protein
MKMFTLFISLAGIRTKEMIITTALLLSVGLAAKAQAPANNDTSGAVTLLFNPDLSNNNAVSGTMVGATNSTITNPGIPNPACATGGLVHDVWYKFAPTSSKIGVSFTATAYTMVVALYHIDGSGNMVYDVCNTFGNSTGSPVVFLNNVTPNVQYYARVYNSSSSASSTPTFTICVGAVPPPPVNDESTNATTIIPSSGLNCTNTVSGTTIGATASADAQPPASSPSCGGATTTDDDVWYKFTAGAAGAQLMLTGFSNTQSMYAALYSGTPGSLTLVSGNCQNLVAGAGAYIFSGLTIGTTYYIRVYTAGTTTSPFYANFSICLGNMPPVPSNDEITNAISLTVNQNAQCAATTSGTTYSATQSASPTAVSQTTCNTFSSSTSTYPTNDDVWYQFNTGSGTNFQLNATGTNTQATLNAALYSGPAASATFVTGICGAATANLSLIGLTTNTTYYLRVYTSAATTQTYSDFNLCLSQLPATPVNDNQAGAITLTLNSDWACGTSLNGSTYSATQSTGMADPTSSPTGTNDDVWYKFTPATSTIYAKFSNVSASSMVGQVYDASLNPVGAAISNSGFVGSLTTGSLYYFRVFTTSATVPIVFSTFNLCMGNAPTVPANDECSGAITILPNNDYNVNNVVNATTANATPSGNDDPTGLAGLSGIDDDVWFRFTANATANRVNIVNVVGNATTMNIGLYHGTCGALILDSSISSVTSKDFTGLTIGQNYYLRVYTSATQAAAPNVNFANFSIYIGKSPAAPANDSIANATMLTVTNGFGGYTVFGTLAGSTLENIPVPSCVSTIQSGDVWYKALVPSSGQLIVQEDAVNTSNTDDLINIYTGTPGNLASIACIETGNPISGNMPRLPLSGLTPGATIYIRVATASSLIQNLGNFGIEVWDPTTLPNVSPGGNCITSSPVAIGAASGNNYTWVPLRDASGNIIAELLPNGNDLGVVNASVYENTTGAIRTSNGVKYLDRNITITPATQPVSNVTVRLYLTNAEYTALQNADPSLATIANLNISKTNQACSAAIASGDQLLLQTANGTYNSTNKYIEYSTPSFSTMFMRAGGSTPLPIELLDFKGYNNGAANQLSWNTGTATSQLSYFELQRSADGNTYEGIATIPYNSKTNAYSYSDRTPSNGTNLYRLLMVDENKGNYYSAVVTINTDEKNSWAVKLFPNPVRNQLQFSIIGNVDQNASIHLFSLIGKQLKAINVNNNFETIDLSDLPVGTYILKYMDNSHSYVSKISKQ